MDSCDEKSSPVQPIEPEAERIFNLINLSGSCSDNSLFDDSDVDPDFRPINDHSTDDEEEGNKIFNRQRIIKHKKKNKQDDSVSVPLSTDLAENSVIENITPEIEVEPDIAANGKQPSRKKQSNPSMWKKNINKNLRNQGKEYEDSHGNVRRSRTVSEGCAIECVYKCRSNFSETDRHKIHEMFWSLSGDEKLGFFSKFTRKVPKQRKRTKNEKSRRQDTFLYFFNKNVALVQVCKVFLLKTLDVSQNRIYHFYKTKTTDIGTNKPSCQGRYVKFKISEQKLDKVRDHIKSFPIMESHYCRASTTRQYLEAGLNISRMYSMYLSNNVDPVKLNIYSKIFNEEFNLSFYKPKKDQCDRCVAHKLAKKSSTSEISVYNKHKQNNMLAKIERDADRSSADPLTAILCYDLQNVFALPKANVSNFFYRRKFSVYNLTAHCSINKITYCAIWHEGISGRAGNDLASSLIKILENVVTDNPEINRIILWSDSCVPQNRNRITALALLKFMEKHTQIIEVQQKFSEPGHSQVQEIDAVHSTIEKFLKNLELYSPINLIRILKSMNYTKVKLKIMQMRLTDFKNYNAASIGMVFPPFASTSSLIYEKSNLSQIKYRCGYNSGIETCSLIKMSITRKVVSKLPIFKLPSVGQCQFQYKMSAEKKRDVRSMLAYMPEVDKQFYKVYVG